MLIFKMKEKNINKNFFKINIIYNSGKFEK